MAAGNPSFSTFVSSTIRNYGSQIVENLKFHNVVLWLLAEKGFAESEPGSRSITRPLLYARANGGSSYRMYDTLSVEPSEGFTHSEFEWKFYAQPVAIAGEEEFKNSGDKTRIFNLLKGKMQQAEMTIKLDMNTDLVSGDGTGNSGKNITGLGIAVEDGAAWSTYGGIDGSDSLNSWWRNQYTDFDTFMGGTSTFGAAKNGTVGGIAALTNMRNKCTLQGSKPDLIITTQTIAEAYENQVQGTMGRVDMTKGSKTRRIADAGFDAIEFSGIPMVFDDDMPSEEVIFLNSDYMRWVTGTGRNFTNSDFQKPENQDARSSHIFWAGNLVTVKRDQHGRIAKLTV